MNIEIARQYRGTRSGGRRFWESALLFTSAGTKFADFNPRHVGAEILGLDTYDLAGDQLVVEEQSETRRHPFVVDILFSSLAVALGEKAIGVVLSGSGADGALGLKAIRDGGGIAIAQRTDGDPSFFEGMPTAAIAVGAVDMFLPAGDMAQRLLSLAGLPLPKVDQPTTPDLTESMEGHRAVICKILNDQLGHDFSGYKKATFSAEFSAACNCLDWASKTTSNI